MSAASREASPASFASASGGESEEEPLVDACNVLQGNAVGSTAEVPQRPAGLPRLQQHFGTDANGQSKDLTCTQGRPSFLPPEVLPPCSPTDGDSDPVSDSAIELLSWLTNEASGAQPEHIERIVAWLVQLLRWAYIEDFGTPEELRAPAREALVGLPDLALVRVFAEASASDKSRTCGLEAHLLALFSTAAENQQNAEQQRATLCLLAFAASGMPPAGDSACSAALWNAGVPSWTLSALETHSQNPAVCLWACALLTDLAVWRRCQHGSIGPLPPEAVAVLLTVLERFTGALGQDGAAAGAALPRGTRRRLLKQSAHRALQATLKGTVNACRALEASWQKAESDEESFTSARPGVASGARLLTEGAHALAETLHGLEEAAGTAAPRCPGVPHRLLVESICRALASTWQGDEDDALRARALKCFSAVAALPSSWLPSSTIHDLPSSWSHCALPALVRLGCGLGGCGRGPAFMEVRTKLATMLQSSTDPILLASCISSLEGLARAEAQEPSHCDSERHVQLRPDQLRRRRGPPAVGVAITGAAATPNEREIEAFATWEDVLTTALGAVQDFRALASLQAVTASFLTLLLEYGRVSRHAVREAGGREVLVAADSAGRLPPGGAAVAKALALDEPW